MPKFYLKFFETPDEQGCVRVYERNKKPKCVSFINAAVKTHLNRAQYGNGAYHTLFEDVLAQLDGGGSDLFSRIEKMCTHIRSQNSNETISPAPVAIKNILSFYISMQFVRTMAFRTSWRKLETHLSKIMRLDILHNTLVSKPNYFNNHFFRRTLESFDYIDSELVKKNITVLHSESTEFITSDWPVSLIPLPSSDNGFVSSSILFPLNRYIAIILENTHPKYPSKMSKDEIMIKYKKIGGELVTSFNDVTIQNAQKYLFGSLDSVGIKESFDITNPKEHWRNLALFRRRSEAKSRLHNLTNEVQNLRLAP